METVEFGALRFGIEDGKILLYKCGYLGHRDGDGFVGVHIAGENKCTHLGRRTAHSSECDRLTYASHTVKGNTLEIVQNSPNVEVKTVFEKFADTNAVRVYSTVKNTTESEIVLEEASAFTVKGMGKRGIDGADNLHFTRFTQTHYAECQPQRFTFRELGLFHGREESTKRIAFSSAGSQTTNEELPQGIIEDVEEAEYTMFQIESNASWYYEISDLCAEYYLWLGSASLQYCGWYKRLKPQETYRTVSATLSFGKSAQDAIGQMTAYRRHIAGRSAADENLPAVFNEYMWCSADSPNEERTRRLAKKIAETGVEYYVIDCGWHNEEPGDKVYPYVGQWKESQARFPHGVRATTDYIRSLGLKAGLWIEPEIVGVNCKEMLAYYGDDCFLRRFGRKIAVGDRYFLDYRKQKVRAYMTETIRRMVEDYGAEYIKFDYNQDLGIGCDGDGIGDGLEQAANAFLSWVDEMRAAFPETVFEACASGGMRLDYKTLSHFSITSTSDQTDYCKYPYIVGNILSAVLPEQAAVWSYPVGLWTENKAQVQAKITDEQVALNMINCFLGRMHLASRLDLLTDTQFALVAEGVEYYNRLKAIKREAVPFFPCGFTRFAADSVAAGLQMRDTVYLAVWGLKTETVTVPIPKTVQAMKIAYPSASKATVTSADTMLTVQFPAPKQAVFLELHKRI